MGGIHSFGSVYIFAWIFIVLVNRQRAIIAGARLSSNSSAIRAKHIGVCFRS